MNTASITALCVLTAATPAAYGQTAYAARTTAFRPGTTAAAGFNAPSAPLGEPTRITSPGSPFAAPVSFFSPPFGNQEIISIGEGGFLTLELERFAVPQAGGPEIGVFTNAGYGDTDGNFSDDNARVSGDFAGPFDTFGIDAARVQVSADNVTFVDVLPQAIRFDIPTNAYTNATSVSSLPASPVASDFGQPFVGGPNDFAGLRYFSDTGSSVQSVLNGGGGGTWLDISGLGLAEVGYVRFLVDDDGDAATGLNFELDAVSVARNAVGRPVPEPASALLVGLGAVAALRRRS